MVEFVVAHPQAGARLAGVDRVGIIGEGVAHGLEAAGRGQQFGFADRHDRAMAEEGEANGKQPGEH